MVTLRNKWDSLRANEPFSTIGEQLSILSSRGLFIGDENRAIHALRVIGYHRLRDYFRPFYFGDASSGQRLSFRDGASFNAVLNLYYLDRELRFFLLGPLEKLEVSLRGQIIDAVGRYRRSRFSAESQNFNLFHFEHFNLQNGDNRRTYDYVLRRALDAACILGSASEGRALRAAFVSAQKSGSPFTAFDPYAPWPILHKLSFGPLTQIFNIMKPEIAKEISQGYDVTIRVLRSSFAVLSSIRNSCAHHEPIWFRSAPRFEIPEKLHSHIWPAIHAGPIAVSTTNDYRIYEICATIHYYLGRVSENTTWYKRLRGVIDRFDREAQNFMGFPPDWSGLQFWRSTAI